MSLRRSKEHTDLHHRSRDGGGCCEPIPARRSASPAPCTCPNPSGHPPDRIQIEVKRTVTISDAENSSGSDRSKSNRKKSTRRNRKARRHRTPQETIIRRSSDEFLSFKNSYKSGSESSDRPSCRSWDGGYTRKPGSHKDQRVTVSKSVENPAVTVRATSIRKRGARSKSVEVRFEAEVPPPAEAQPPCCSSQGRRVAEAPCYPCRDTAYHPSRCESASSRSSTQKYKSKCTKNVVVYCPERQGSGDDPRSECWADVSQRCLEDRKTCPSPGENESTLDVTIITDMKGSKIPGGQRRLSTDHHERPGKHLDNLNKRENPMDDHPRTTFGRVAQDFEFGQKLDANREEEQVVGRNRFRRQSLNPPLPEDDEEEEPGRQPEPEPEQLVVYPEPGPTPIRQQSPTTNLQPYSSAPSRTQQENDRRPSSSQPQPYNPSKQSYPRSSQQCEPGPRENISNYNIRLTEDLAEDSDSHTFPFQETPSGNIKISKRLVSFENNKVAVLVAKPEKTRVNIKQDRHSGPPPPSACRIPPSPPPEPEATCGLPPVIWDEPRFREYQDEQTPVRKPRCQSESCSRERTCALEPPRRSSSPAGCNATTCRARSQTPDRNRRESMAYGNEGSRGSMDFMENIHNRLKTACNPDTRIKIGCQEFPCHALALQCYSKYFDKIKRPKEKIMEIEIPERVLNAKYFPNLMDWILIDDKDKLLVVDRDNAVNLFSAAIFLQIPDLKRDCLDFVKTKVEAAEPSIIKMYQQAREKENCGELVTLLATKLSTLFPQLYKTKQFLHMEVKELILILSADNIMIKSEIEVFDAAARWLLYDWDRRRPYTVAVMKTVRFGLLSPLQLAQMKHAPGDENLPSYAQLFTFEPVHKLMDEGLAFAVFRESYKGRSGELNRWVNKTGIVAPRLRHNLDEEPDVNRLPATVNFESEREEDGYQRRSASKYREPNPNPPPRRRRTSISEEVTQKSIKTLGENNVGVSRFSRAHSNDFTEEDVDPKATAGRRASWRDPENSTVTTNVAGQMSGSGKGRGQAADDDGEWMNVEYDQEQVGAAVLIQSKFRGWIARRRYEEMKRAALVIQAAQRAQKKGAGFGRSSQESSQAPRPFRKPSLPTSAQRVRKLDLKDSDAVIIFGGSNPNIPVGEGNDPREIYQLNPLANQWKLMGLMPEPRTHAGAIHMSGSIIIFGGSDPRYKTARGKPTPCSSTWSLNIETGSWKELANMTEAKTNFGYAALNGKIFVFGGVDIEGNALDSCESYDPQYNSWDPIISMDGPRLSMAVTQLGDKIWIAGGLTKDTRLPMLKSVIFYDIKKNSFFPAPDLPQPRCYATMTSYYDRIFIVAGAGRLKKGESTHSMSEVMCLEDGEWQLFGNLKTARHGQCQVKLGKYVLLIGGVNSETKLALNTVESFNLEKGTVSTKVESMLKEISGVAGIVLH